MKRFFYFFFFMVFLACSTEKYGNVSSNLPDITVKDAILNDLYLNKEVKLEGKIVTQCAASGCWFFLKDDTGQILVDLKPLNLGLPQRTGKRAIVNGVIIKEPSGQVIVSAKGLMIK